MFDTVNDPAKTFTGLPVEAVAAYGNGRYANYDTAKAQFPNAHLLKIDVSGQGIGEAGDFEPGDMQFSSAGSWAKRRINAGIKRPVLYFSLSNWRAVLDSVAKAGLARSDVRLWTAHYTGNGHLCATACGFGFSGTSDATQWGSADHPATLPAPYAGHHLDVSFTTEGFWDDSEGGGTGPAPTPGSAPVLHFDYFGQDHNATCPDVRIWQQQMKQRGWGLEVDGVYGPGSEQVCRSFQSEKGLTVDGQVGPQTWRAAWTATVT